MDRAYSKPVYHDSVIVWIYLAVFCYALNVANYIVVARQADPSFTPLVYWQVVVLWLPMLSQELLLLEQLLH